MRYSADSPLIALEVLEVPEAFLAIGKCRWLFCMPNDSQAFNF